MKKVIFIQGIHNFKLRNVFVLNALRSMGHEVVYFPMFYTVHQTEKQIELINQINIFLESQEGEFILLGHSFGGIISYSLREDLYQKIDTIITIASPHQVRFGWFKTILDKLPYKTHIKVRSQESYGFFFDTTVPYIFTEYKNSHVHRNVFGTHNRILNSTRMVKTLLK